MSKKPNQSRRIQPATQRPHPRSALPKVLIGLLLVGVGAGFLAYQQGLIGRDSGSVATASATGGIGRPGMADGYNLLLVTFDTTRADRVGCYGRASARTPTLDRLAAHGVRVEHAIAPAPMTLPSHASLLTGLDCPTHGARANGMFKLEPTFTTLAESLSAGGYRTAAFIAAFVLDGRYGLSQGFGTYDDLVNPTGESMSGIGYPQRDAAAVTDAAIRWFDTSSGDAPYFAWVHYYDPHFPYEPPAGYRDLEHPYDGEVAFADAQLGRLLEYLDGRDLLDRTLVVVTSDHGEGLTEHNESGHSFLIYDATQRVPLIFSNPTLFPQPQVVRDRVVGLIDVMPTVLALLGVEVDGKVDGLSIASQEIPADRAIHIETLATYLNNGWAPLHGLRRAGDKFILAPTPEYYDLKADPGEVRNLFRPGHPNASALEDELLTMMDGWPTAEELLRNSLTMTDEERSKLAALGYLGGHTHDESFGKADPKDMILQWDRITGAEHLSGAGRHADATKQIDECVERDPTNARAWHTAALIHKRAGDVATALGCVTKAVELTPDAELFVLQGQLYMANNRFDESMIALDQAERLAPDDGGLHVARGDFWAFQGQFDKALAEFEIALRVDPNNSGATAREKIALCQQRLGRGG